MAKVVDTLLELAGAYATSGAITAELKTNLGPPITIYSGSGGPGILDALGIKAAVIVKRDGQTIATTGDAPATEPLVIAALALLAALVVALLIVAVRRF